MTGPSPLNRLGSPVARLLDRVPWVIKNTPAECLIFPQENPSNYSTLCPEPPSRSLPLSGVGILYKFTYSNVLITTCRFILIKYYLNPPPSLQYHSPTIDYVVIDLLSSSPQSHHFFFHNSKFFKVIQTVVIWNWNESELDRSMWQF